MTDTVKLEEWATIEDAAALSGYSEEYLRRLAREDKVRAFKAGRDWLLHRTALLEYRAHMFSLGAARYDPRRKTENGND